jgi:hypothetical protein
MLSKPFSTKAKRNISWDEGLNAYMMSSEDEEILTPILSKHMDIFRKMLQDLSTQKYLRPFERSLPCHQKLLYKFFWLIVVLLYLYLCFILLQLALFNLILLGLFLMGLMKINDTFTAATIKAELKYKNKDFLRFIKEKNEEFQKIKVDITLSGGLDGKWIEVQLNETEEAQ